MPNIFVDTYREGYPNTPLTDDEITVRFAENFSSELEELYSLDPAFKDDMNRIFGMTETVNEGGRNSVTTGDRLAQAYTKFVEGVTGTAAGLPESMAIGAAALNRTFSDVDTSRLPGETDEEFDKRFKEIGGSTFLGVKSETPYDPKQTFMGGVAEFMKEDLTDFITPEISKAKQKQMQGDFFTESLPSALGSGVGFILGGLGVGQLIKKGLGEGAEMLAKEAGEKALKAGLEKGMTREAAQQFADKFQQKAVKDIIGPATQKAFKRKTAWATAGLGAAVNGPAGYQDAINSGATPTQAFTSFLLNAGVGTSEVIPINKFIGRVSGMGEVGKSIGEQIKRALMEGGEEALQELMQGAAGDAIAKWVVEYDPNREFFTELADEAGAGGASGFILSLATSAIGGKVRRIEAAESGVDPEAVQALSAKIEAGTPLTEEEQVLASEGGLSVSDSGVASIPEKPESVARTAYEGPKSGAIVALAQREAEEGFTREVQEEYNKLLGVPGSEDAMEKRLYDQVKFNALSKNEAEKEVAETESTIEDVIAKVEAGNELTAEEAALLQDESEKKGRALTAAEKVDLVQQATRKGYYGEQARREQELADAEKEADRQIKAQLDFAKNTGQIPDASRIAGNQSRKLQAQEVQDQQNMDDAAEAEIALQQSRARVAAANQAAAERRENAIEEKRAQMVAERQQLKKSRQEIQATKDKKRDERESDFTSALETRDKIQDRIQQVDDELLQNPDLYGRDQANRVKKLERSITAAIKEYGSLDNAEAQIPGIKELDNKVRNYQQASREDKQAAYDELFGDLRETPEPTPATQGAEATPATGNLGAVQQIAEVAAEYIGQSPSVETAITRIRRLKETLEDEKLNPSKKTAYDLIDGLLELEAEIQDLKDSPRSKADENEVRSEIKDGSIRTLDYKILDETVEESAFIDFRPKEATNQWNSFIKGLKGKTSLAEKSRAAKPIDLDNVESNNRGAFAPAVEKIKAQAQQSVSEGRLQTASNRVERSELGGADLNATNVDATGYYTLEDNNAQANRVKDEVSNLDALMNSSATTLEQLEKEGINATDSTITYQPYEEKGVSGFKIYVNGNERGRGTSISAAVDSAAVAQANRVGQLLFRDGSVEEGGRNTRRIAVLQAPDGKVVALGIHETRDTKAMVTNIKSTKATSMPVSDLLVKQGYRVVGSIKTKTTSIGFKEVYENKDQYNAQISSDVIKSANRAGKLAEGMPTDADPDQAGEYFDETTIVRNAPRRGVFPRANEAAVNTAFSNIVDAAQTAGVEVNLLEQELADVEKKAAAYMTIEDGKVVAVLAMNSVNNPTAENTVDLLHEVNHVVHDQLAPEIQEVVGDAIGKASDKQLGIEGSAFMFDSSFVDDVPNELRQEERLVEAVAREMEESGFDPANAKGLVGNIVRVFKNISFAARMAWQRLVKGKDALSPRLAKEHFRLHAEAFLTGNTVPNFINYLVLKPNLLQVAKAMSSDPSTVFISKNGYIEVESVDNDSLPALRFNNKYAGFRRYSGRDVDSRTNPTIAKRGAAANNAVVQALRFAFASFTASGANRNKIGGVLTNEEGFLSKLLGRTTPQKILEEIARESGSDIAATTLSDLDSVEDKPRAAMEADNLLTKIINRLKDRYSKAQEILNPDAKKSATQRRAMLYAKLDDLKSQYRNLSYISNMLTQGIEGTIKGLETNKEKARKKIRDILQIVHPDSADVKIYAREFNKPFLPEQMDQFNEMIQGGIDFTKSTNEIMDQIKNSRFSALVPQNRAQGILMSKFILMARNNPVAIDMLFLREANPDHSRRFQRVLSIAFQNDRNANKRAFKKYTDIFPETNDEKTRTGEFARFHAKVHKLLNTIEKHKKEYAYLDAEINDARNDIALYESVRSTLAGEKAVFESLYDKELEYGGLQWEPNHDQEYMVPSSPDQELVDVEQSTQKLNLNQKVDLGLINKHIERMGEWLNNQPENQRGAIWKTIKRQREKLMTLPADQIQREVSHSWVMRLMGDFGTKLEMIGSPLSKKVQQSFRKLSNYMNSYGGENARRIGRDWAIALTDFKKVLKRNGKYIKKLDHVRRQYYDRAFHYFDANRDVLNENPGEKGQRMLMNGFKQKLAEEEGVEFVNAIWPTFQRLIVQTRKASNHINGIRKELGLSVKDEIGGFTFFRDSVGDSLTTTMRKPAASVQGVFQILTDVGWDKVDFLANSKLQQQYLEQPENFETYVQSLYPEEVMADFVGPLATDGKDLFQSMTEQGFKRPIPQVYIKQAFENNPNNLLDMLNELSEQVGITTPAAKAEFFADSIKSLEKIYNTIKSTQETGSNLDGFGEGTATPPHIMMDARKTSSWPFQWVEYATFGERNMYQYAKHLSAESAFGRDMALMKRDMALLRNQLKNEVAHKDEIEEKLAKQGINPGFKGSRTRTRYNKAYNELAKGAKYKTTRIRLEKADQKLRVLEGINKNITAWLQSESSTPMEYYAHIDFIRMLSGFTVQGYGTALIDTISIVEQPFRKLGLGKEAFKQLARNAYNSLGIGTGSIFQLFNKSIGFQAEKMKLLQEFGLDDMTATTDRGYFGRIKQNYDASLADEFVGGVFTKPLEYAARAGRAVLDTGAGRAEEGRAAFPAIRVATPFTSIAKQSAMANMMSTWSAFDTLVLKTAKLMQSNPQYNEIIKNEGVLFDDDVLSKYGLTMKKVLKDLGYGNSFIIFNDTKAFLSMYENLQRNGVSLEALTNDYIQRRNKDKKAPPIADKNIYRALANLTVTDTMLDTDILTRPSGMVSSSVGQAFMPLVGWSIAKSNDVVKEFREPGGQNSWKGVGMALKSYLAIFPIQLIYAALRDEYDEEALGKKSDVQKGKGFLGMPTMDEFGDTPFESMQLLMERQDRVGAFGILGEGATWLLGKAHGNVKDFGIDSRVFFLNSLNNFLGTWGNLIRQEGVPTYQTFYRPLAQSLGGSGLIQNIQLANNVTDELLEGIPVVGEAVELEAGVNHRIGTQNYIRAAGRQLNLDVRKRRGMAGTPSKRKAYVGQMALAALTGNTADFITARDLAIKAAREEGKEEPEKSVLASFQSYHPLKQPFKTQPTEREFEQILQTLDDDAREGVRKAVDNYNRYIQNMGGNPYEGKKERQSSFRMRRPQLPGTLRRPKMQTMNYRAASTAF